MFLIIVLVLVITTAYGHKTPPHIVFVIADDMGWNDVGFHGSSQISTPNIDALAYNGVILNNHYTLQMCTPSRASLMTGQYAIRTGLQGYPIKPAEERALPPGKILPEYMRELGYRTELVGKWHLGATRRNETPTYRGFDSHIGYYNGFTNYYDHVLEAFFEEKWHFGYDQWRNTTPAWDFSGKYATDVYTDESIRIINEHNKIAPRKSLFLILSHMAPHAGNRGKLLEAPQEAIDKHDYIVDSNRRTYAGMISKLDDSVGAVVEALKINNMLENTVIIFISDNGAPTVGQYLNWGSNYPLRGVKETLWEGGLRGVACIWSPLIKVRGVLQSLIHISDWLPTLISAAGGDSNHLNIDGVDQWPMLTKFAEAPRNDILLNIEDKELTSAARIGKWKLIQGISSNKLYSGYHGEKGTRNKRIVEYNIDEVLSSPTAEALANLCGTKHIGVDDIKTLRQAAEVKCPKRDISDSPSTCNPTSPDSICLFDLELDPCELNDVSRNHTAIVEELEIYINYYRQQLVPQMNKDMSRAGLPELHNFTWSYWLDQPARA